MYKHSLSRFKSRAVWCPWHIEVHNQPKPNTRHGQFSLPPSLMVKSTAQREQHKGRETYNNPVWTHMRSKHSNQQLNIERHKEWNMTGQLWAASSRETDGCTLGTGRVPRRVMEWGQKGGTERFEVIISKVCPRGEEKMLWTSILHSAACMGRTRTHKHANTGCTHKPEIDLSSCAGEGGRY